MADVKVQRRHFALFDFLGRAFGVDYSTFRMRPEVLHVHASTL